MSKVEGTVAFITGGSSGIGLGIARAFVNAGMRVVVTYRTKSHLERALRHFGDSARDRVHAIALDVTDRPGMAKAAEETVRVYGKVHVLVNNAAVGTILPLGIATYDDWDWVRSVNIDGVFNGIREFLPRIKSHGEGGHIVTTSSMGGLVAAKAGLYSTTKFAVVGMMEALRPSYSIRISGFRCTAPGASTATFATRTAIDRQSLRRQDSRRARRNRPYWRRCERNTRIPSRQAQGWTRLRQASGCCAACATTTSTF